MYSKAGVFAEDMLRKRAQPPPNTDFVDTFKEFKIAFNLLVGKHHAFSLLKALLAIRALTTKRANYGNILFLNIFR